MHRDVCEGEGGGKMSPLPSVPPPPPSSAAAAATTVESSSVSSVAAPSSIGVNLRVTGHCSQGGRKYMEDFFSVAYHQSESVKDLEYAFVGIYDGHGGSEAATFAKEHLMMEIINQKLFWSDSDQDVLRAIREGYIATHYAMWREQEKWPKTATGLLSTAGTTATVAFIRREKIFIGHVGDSGIVLGYQNPDESFWRAKQLTQDHKPESAVEKARIVNSGGKVVVKSGVPRVVWNRPRTGHKGPVRRSTPIDEIPFLAVARSLGDLWSYNSALNEFVVSPDPDVKVIKINPKTFRCLIFGTDGLWNVVSASDAVDTVREKEIINERISKMRGEANTWCNPSKGLVEKALKTWGLKKMRADNTSVVTVILYPPGATSTKDNCINECTSSYGLEYMHMNGEIHPSDSYTHLPFHANHQKFKSSSLYEQGHQLYDTDDFNQSNQLPHYDTIATSPALRHHLQLQQQHQDDYASSFINREECTYTNSYETNCDTDGYLYYDDQTSNTYMSSFAESYNSLLTSSIEREDSNRSDSSYAISSNGEISNGSSKSDPSEYHSYHSLHHTGLAGHDRVQQHYPNNEYQLEQLLYQEQCMSAEEGYSLTKLETRGEQQLRGNNCEQSTSSGVQTFQIFGSERSSPTETSYNQYNNISSSYPNSSYNNSDSSNSNFLNSYDDATRCCELDVEDGAIKQEAILSSGGKTTSLCIERLDTVEVDRLRAESFDACPGVKPLLEVEMEVVEEEDKESVEVEVRRIQEADMEEVEGDKENPDDESIQIHEISSSVLEEEDPPQMAKHLQEEIKKKPKHKSQTPAVSENVIDSTPLKKTSIPKLVLYPNVPNENHRTSRRSSVQQYPRTLEKRMLRSMTVDYSKRTLRSRNSLSKDMKAKCSANTNLRRSNVVQNKFVKAVQSSMNTENSSVIKSKSLNLRSRQIGTTVGIWSKAEPTLTSVSSSSCLSGQKQQRKSKPVSFSNSSKMSTTSRHNSNNESASSSSTLLVTPTGARLTSTNLSFNLTPQIAMSFAKRTSLRNSGWSSAKTTTQTRTRVQKRLSR